MYRPQSAPRPCCIRSQGRTTDRASRERRPDAHRNEVSGAWAFRDGQHIAVLILRLFAWVIRDVALPAHSALSLQEIRHLNSVSLRFTRHAREGRGRNRAFKRVGNLTFGSGGG
jgi:hypothetical protein